MHYYDHALLSASKFNCHLEDTLKLHKLMDSSKHFFPASQHRLFSHNTWFIQVLTERKHSTCSMFDSISVAPIFVLEEREREVL